MTASDLHLLDHFPTEHVRQQGRIVSVVSQNQGSTIVTWTGNEMLVDNAADFSREGGQFTVDTSPIVYTYTGVIEGEENQPDTVITVETAPAGKASLPVRLWPAAVEVLAEVEIADQPETITALVPYSMRPTLPEGMRDPVTAEYVDVALVAGEWQIVDIPGRDAKVQFGHLEVGILDGETLNGVTINGGTIHSPSATAVPRTSLADSQLQIIRPDGDGGELATVTLGGSTSDALWLRNSNDVQFGFNSQGLAAFGIVSVDGLAIGGTDILTMLNRLPGGWVTGQVFNTTHATKVNNIAAGNTELGIVEIGTNQLVPYRVYRIVYNGYVRANHTGVSNVELRIRANLGSSNPPSISSSQLNSTVVQAPASNGLAPVWFTSEFTTSYNNNRFLLTLRNGTANAATTLMVADSYPAWFYIEDIGPIVTSEAGSYSTGGGTPYSGTTNTAPVVQKETYTTRWKPNAIRSWRSGTVVTDSMRHGYYGGQMYAMSLFGSSYYGETGKSIASAISGATIQSARVKLRNTHTYASSGMTAYLGRTTSSTLPASPQTSGGSAQPYAWTPGQYKWVSIPTSWVAGMTGITLGEGAGTSSANYGKFSNLPADIELEITYTK